MSAKRLDQITARVDQLSSRFGEHVDILAADLGTSRTTRSRNITSRSRMTKGQGGTTASNWSVISALSVFLTEVETIPSNTIEVLIILARCDTEPVVSQSVTFPGFSSSGPSPLPFDISTSLVLTKIVEYCDDEMSVQFFSSC